MVVVAGGPAASHQRAALTVTTPAEGDVVADELFEVVVTASGGQIAAAEYELRLDGERIDANGGVGSDSVFTTFSIAAGQTSRLLVGPVAPGPHELRLTYARDPDDSRPDIVRRFRVGASTLSPGPAAPSAPDAATTADPTDEGGGAGSLVGAVLAVVAASGLVLADARRRPH